MHDLLSDGTVGANTRWLGSGWMMLVMSVAPTRTSTSSSSAKERTPPPAPLLSPGTCSAHPASPPARQPASRGPPDDIMQRAEKPRQWEKLVKLSCHCCTQKHYPRSACLADGKAQPGRRLGGRWSRPSHVPRAPIGGCVEVAEEHEREPTVAMYVPHQTAKSRMYPGDSSSNRCTWATLHRSRQKRWCRRDVYGYICI
jgi:hypothetical protein